MSQMPDYELEVADEIERPDDPLTCAYENFQESDEWKDALAAVARVKVDDVDIAPFTTRDIPLSEVVGEDAAIDVAAEGIIFGFEAGFRYGRQEKSLTRAMEVIASLTLLIDTAERNGPKAFDVTIQRARKILARAPEIEEKTDGR